MIEGFIALEMMGTVGPYTYRCARQRGERPIVMWSVRRWRVGDPLIPPSGEILTTVGWEHQLKHTGQVLYIGEQRLAKLIKEQ